MSRGSWDRQGARWLGLGVRCDVVEVGWNAAPQWVRVPYTSHTQAGCCWHPSSAGHEKPCANPGGPPPKTVYSDSPIVHEYREGTVKSTPGGE